MKDLTKLTDYQLRVTIAGQTIEREKYFTISIDVFEELMSRFKSLVEKPESKEELIEQLLKEVPEDELLKIWNRNVKPKRSEGLNSRILNLQGYDESPKRSEVLIDKAIEIVKEIRKDIAGLSGLEAILKQIKREPNRSGKEFTVEEFKEKIRSEEEIKANREKCYSEEDLRKAHEAGLRILSFSEYLKTIRK